MATSLGASVWFIKVAGVALASKNHDTSVIVDGGFFLSSNVI